MPTPRRGGSTPGRSGRRVQQRVEQRPVRDRVGAVAHRLVSRLGDATDPSRGGRGRSRSARRLRLGTRSLNTAPSLRARRSRASRSSTGALKVNPLLSSLIHLQSGSLSETPRGSPDRSGDVAGSPESAAQRKRPFPSQKSGGYTGDEPISRRRRRRPPSGPDRGVVAVVERHHAAALQLQHRACAPPSSGTPPPCSVGSVRRSSNASG